MTPTVSVVMLVYNGEKYLRQAIESILKQTFSDFELLVIDDGSTDNTPNILQAYTLRDSRIAIHRLPHNRGLAHARNAGSSLARGKYLAIMDSDDVSLPERLARQVAYMESHPETDVLSTGAYLINAEGKRQGTLDNPPSHILIVWALCFYDPITNPAVMMRREVALAVGGYREEYPPTEDYDLWARLSSAGIRFQNLPERLLLLRQHGQNATVTKRLRMIEMSARISRAMIKQQVGLEPPVTPVELREKTRRLSATELEQLTITIHALFNHFVRQPGVTSSEKRFLRRETAIQLARLIRNVPRLSSRLRLVIQSLRYDPLAVAEIIRRAVKSLNTEVGDESL